MKKILMLAMLGACALIMPVPAAAQVEIVVAGSRSMIGVHTEPATVDGRSVVRVLSVVPGLPAEQAGLQAGDLIVSIDGQPASTRLLSADREVGQRVRLRISRDGSERDVELATVERRLLNMQRVLVPSLPDSVLGQMAIIMSNVRMQADSLSGVVTRMYVDTLTGARGERIFVRDSLIARGFALDSGVPLRRAQGLTALRIGEDSIRVVRFGNDSVHVLRFGQDTVHMRFPAPGATFELRPGGEVYFHRMQGDSLRALLPSVPADSLLRRGSTIYTMRPSDIATTTIFAGTTAIAGAELSELNPGLAEYFGAMEGVLVLNAVPGTPAERAGIRPGDVIVQVNGEPVANIAAIRRAVGGRAGAPVQMRLLRRGETVDVTVGG